MNDLLMQAKKTDSSSSKFTLRNLFKTHHLFSKLSGIELNTTKTELLTIGDEHDEKEYDLQAATRIRFRTP